MRQWLEFGIELEEVMEKVKDSEYGGYSLKEVDENKIKYLYILEGMSDWQDRHNIGINIQNIYGNRVMWIFDKEARQLRRDELMSGFRL